MMSHSPFKQKPNYKMHLHPKKISLIAQNARQAGQYNLTTLWLFRKSWLLSENISHYLKYLSFRRDLGYPLNQHQYRTLKRFFKSRIQFYLWAFSNPKRATLYKKLLRSNNQSELEQIFKEQLQKVSTIQLVGNSGNLLGSNCGKAIDQAEIVVRFNLCFNQQTKKSDTGQKVDIWVGAPDFNHSPPKANWYIISGPDMLSWLNKLPKPFQERTPLLSAPLDCWRHLVRILAAPPSAGLLIAYWFRNIAPKTEIWLCGYTFSPNHSQYHHADYNHKAVPRHNWHEESKLLQKWKSINIIKEGVVSSK